MNIDLCIEPYTIKRSSICSFSHTVLKLDNFPHLYIDTDSYFIGSQLITGIDVYSQERHHFAVGKSCAVAGNTAFIISMNHDYRSIIQGVPSFLKDMPVSRKVHLKGTIILQNDVWIGYGATVMAGVILHNGCVVASNAVVTKDVPAYAVVGGNPAKILFYRFDEYTIAGLQKISWWDWPPEVLEERKNDFFLSAEAFVKKYLPEAEQKEPVFCGKHSDKKTVLLIPDVESNYPLYPRIFRQYFEQDRPDTELLIYLPEQCSTDENINMMEMILQQYGERDCYVTLQTGITLDERILFQESDYYITTRGLQTVRRTCLADVYGVRILYGTDEPIFPPELH